MVEAPTDLMTIVPRAHIVVVDDDDDMRALVSSALRKADMDVIEARNGLQVLDYLMRLMRDRTKALPDVIVSDARMPGVNGLSLLESLRACGCSTPVVFMTAFGGEGFRENAERLGAAEIIEKPLDVERLASAVLKQLGR